MANNKDIATNVLEAIGGKDNIQYMTHCLTRLRLNIKDENKFNIDQIKKIDGVLGVQKVGAQYQVIIGQNVEAVYNIVCEMTGIAKEAGIEENLDEKKFSWKELPGKVLDALSGSITPAIPAIIVSALFKMLASVFGPDMLGWISAESNAFTLLNVVGDAGFYFFPCILGYSTAKKAGVTPVLGILMGAILMHPTLAGLAETGGFTVFGIPCALQNYSGTMLPIVFSVWGMALVEKFIKKIVPETLKSLLEPLLTILIMLPISLCVLAPIGGLLGTWLCDAIITCGTSFGFLGTALIGALWSFIVLTGMHPLIFTQIILLISQVGYDPVFSAGATASGWAVVGICIGMALALKDKDKKALCFGYAVTGFVGGITEPGIYGVGLTYKKPLIALVVGGFVGGLYCGITKVLAYSMCPVAGMLEITQYLGGTTMNFINGFIGCGLALVVAAVLTYFLCKKDNIKVEE